jgi:hypothetical protein
MEAGSAWRARMGFVWENAGGVVWYRGVNPRQVSLARDRRRWLVRSLLPQLS